MSAICFPGSATHVAGEPDGKTQRCINCDTILVDHTMTYGVAPFLCAGDRVTVTRDSISYFCPHRGVHGGIDR